MKTSQVTMKLDGIWVPNEDVVNHIKKIIDTEFNTFGYEYATHELQKEYLINRKKVYRLMLAHGLLVNKMIRPIGKREFVQFRRSETSKPLEYLCWDIKYFRVLSGRRNYYLLCILDVYSRKIIDWMFQSSIRQVDLINLLRQVNHYYQFQGVILRNDNGIQFISHKVRNFLKN